MSSHRYQNPAVHLTGLNPLPAGGGGESSDYKLISVYRRTLRITPGGFNSGRGWPFLPDSVTAAGRQFFVRFYKKSSDIMKTADNYHSPAVLNLVSLETGNAVLAGSTGDKTGVSTTGQTKGTFVEDASSTGSSSFNHNWGE